MSKTLEAILAEAEEVLRLDKETTPGPWQIWDGPEYCGGGKDLCIGAGEDWLANMDHRIGADYEERVNHEGSECSDTNCAICSTNELVTIEQQNNANFIAESRTLLPSLALSVKVLARALARQTERILGMRRADECGACGYQPGDCLDKCPAAGSHTSSCVGVLVNNALAKAAAEIESEGKQ